MKALVLAIAVCVALAVGAGCGESGDDASSSTATESNGAGGDKGAVVVKSEATNGTTSKRVRLDKTEPTITPPGGPPPKKLIVKDLEEGTGPPAKYGDELTMMYGSRIYTTGRVFSSTWKTGKPVTFKFGEGEYNAGWETGLPGMRVGGRRELIVPGGFTGRTGIPTTPGPQGTVIYVLDLLAIN